MEFMSGYTIQQRRYIMHAAHPTVGVSIAQLAHGLQYAAVRSPKVQAVVNPRDYCLAIRLENYLADYLGDNYAQYSLDWRCLTIKAKGIPLESISAHLSDCLVTFGHPAAMNSKSLEQIHDYWQCGGSLVGIRIVDFALQGVPGLARELFGGEYQYEHLLVPARINLLPHARKHPLLRGVQPFVLTGGIHRYALLPGEATPILFASAAGETVPVAWVRSRLGRNVFATSLGSAADFRHPCFLRLLANAIVWASR
jgi:hypothetical protein